MNKALEGLQTSNCLTEPLARWALLIDYIEAGKPNGQERENPNKDNYCRGCQCRRKGDVESTLKGRCRGMTSTAGLDPEGWG